MISNDSRYIDAAHETATAHTYDDLGRVEYNADDTLVTNDVSRDTTYLLTTGFASPPPKQYMVKETDNIQLLAYRSQRDPTRWWVLANANPQIRHPFDFSMGDMIHLPE
jgi:hypothetical protein